MLYKFEESSGKNFRFYRFTAYDGQIKAGDILFVPSGENILTIRHTTVNTSYKGQNIGKHLVKSVVEWATEHDKKIIAECPFARKELGNTPEYHEVLANQGA